MDKLPDELILKIGLELPLEDLVSLCVANRRLNSVLCGNEIYWRSRFIRDFGDPGFCSNWKDLYRDYANVYAFGNNHKGKLGLPMFTFGAFGKTFYPSPTLVPEVKAKAAIAGEYLSFIIDLDDEVTIFGDLDEEIPCQLDGIKVKDVSNRSDHIIILDTEGAVWGLGSNSEGQLGHTNVEFVKIPTQMPLPKAKSVSTGLSHTLVLDTEGGVWVFGGNGMGGQLGLGDYENKWEPTRLPLPRRAKAISAGALHSVVLDTEGGVWVFGDNESSQLGLRNPDPQPNPVRLPVSFRGTSVSAGGYFNCY